MKPRLTPLFWLFLLAATAIPPAVLRAAQQASADSVPQVYQVNQPSSMLAQALSGAGRAVGQAARHVGGQVRVYLQEKEEERRRRDLLEEFYNIFAYHAREYGLSAEQYADLRRRVAETYIEQGNLPAPEIDLTGLRDMGHVVRQQAAEMQLDYLVDGTVETLYLNGARRTVWTYRDGKPEGEIWTFARTGELIYIDTYHDGFRVRRRKYDPEGRLEFDQDYPPPGPAAKAWKSDPPA